MSTRPLPHLAARRRIAGSKPLDAARVAVPSFQLAFPKPAGFGVGHKFYELRQAANRVYQSRRGAYRTMAATLGTAEMLDYVRQDVLMRMLEEEDHRFGPLKFTRYRWLDAAKFRAWLPHSRAAAETLYAEYRRKLLSRLTGLDLGTY